MVNIGQISLILTACWISQLFTLMWLVYEVESQCLSFFEHSVGKAGIIFFGCVGFAAIFAVEARRHLPISVVLFATVSGLIGLVNVSMVIAKSTAPHAWATSQHCLIKMKVCKNLNIKVFSVHSVSHIESDCCIPPVVCGYSSYTETFWSNATNLDAHSDCRRWSNDEHELCYRCDTCKTGVMNVLKKAWLVALVISMFIEMISIATLSVAVYIKVNEPELAGVIELQ